MVDSTNGKPVETSVSGDSKGRFGLKSTLLWTGLGGGIHKIQSLGGNKLPIRTMGDQREGLLLVMAHTSKDSLVSNMSRTKLMSWNDGAYRHLHCAVLKTVLSS